MDGPWAVVSTSSRARTGFYLYVSGTVRSNFTAYAFFFTEVYMVLIQSTAHCGRRAEQRVTTVRSLCCCVDKTGARAPGNP